MPRLATVLLALLTTTAFGIGLSWPGPHGTAVAETAAIRLEVVSTAGSPHQPDGLDVGAAARHAVDLINRKGGLLGRAIQLAIREEDCSVARAEAIARDLVAVSGPKRADAVIGHLCSGAAIAASRLYAEAGILMISPGARHPRFTDQRPSPLVLRLAPRDDRLADELAAVVVRRFPGQRIALVHDKSLVAITLANGIDAALRQAGVRPVLREAYTHGEKSYDAIVERLMKVEAHVVILPAQPIEADVMLRRLVSALPSTHVIAGQAVASPQIDELGKMMGERFLLMLPWLTRLPTTAGETTPRSNVWRATHTAVEAWANAVTKAGATDPLAVVRALETDVAKAKVGLKQLVR